MVLPPNPPITKKGGHPKCEHETIRFRKLTNIAAEYFCSKCKESLGIIIDPNERHIDSIVRQGEYPKQGNSIKVGYQPQPQPVVTGKPREWTAKERRELA